MVGCAAVGCSNNSTKSKKSFFRLPANEERRYQWLIKINRKDESGKLWTGSSATRICEEHFEPDMFMGDTKKLVESAIPTIFCHLAPPVKRRRQRAPRETAPPPPAPEPQVASTPQSTDHTYSNSGLSLSNSLPLDSMPNTDTGPDTEPETESQEVQLEAKLKALQLQHDELSRRYQVLRKNNDQTKEKLEKIFNPDQMAALSRKTTNGMLWSEPTVRKALELKFTCGSTGYNMLLGQGLPYPSIRTLQRRLKDIEFEPGVLTSAFQLLQVKVGKFKDHEKYCALTLDEMSISDKTEYDQSSGRVMGHVTLPGHTGKATHGLVFMLSGLAIRWKQTVAYHYSGNSTQGHVYKDIILDIINRAHAVGLFVTCVTCDMGPSNQAMWSSFGITANRYALTTCSIPHPLVAGRKLYFTPDVPHLIKNLKSAFVRFGMTIDQRVISIEHVRTVAEYDKDRDLKLAPNLKDADLDSSHFQKMKVSSALHIFSNSVKSAIEFMVTNGHINASVVKSAKDTAWFIALMNRWFDLMSSRSSVMALSRFDESKYLEATNHLREVIRVFTDIKIGAQGAWKPVQTGIILATNTILELADELLGNGMLFLMTSRLTQDCLENLFSTIRLKTSTPSAIEFRNSLKIVTVAQCLKTPRNSSYQIDESEYLVNYLEKLPPREVSEEEQVIVANEDRFINLDMGTENVVYYLCGWALKVVPDCSICKASLLSEGPLPALQQQSVLALLKEYTKNALRHPSATAYTFLLNVEKMFVIWRQAITVVKNTIEFLMSKITTLLDVAACSHHPQILKRLAEKYLKLRIHIACSEMSKSEQDKTASFMGSKSMAMRAIVKKLK